MHDICKWWAQHDSKTQQFYPFGIADVLIMRRIASEDEFQEYLRALDSFLCAEDWVEATETVLMFEPEKERRQGAQ
jgi:hypothetical protein